MEKTEIKVFNIPDDLCRRAGIAASWITPNSFGVHAYQHVTIANKDTPSMFAPCQPLVHHVRQETVLYEPILRKLVNESSSTFLAVQTAVMVENKSNINNELVILSKQYRSIIRACLENLQEEAERCKENQKEKISDFVTVFYCIECIWHLCEILYIDKVLGDIVLPQLIEWVRFHFPKYERNATNLLCGTVVSGAEMYPNYWNTVIGVLMQGRIEVVRTLLKLHTASDSMPFKTANTSLKAMPIYNVYEGMSLNDFYVKWQHWKTDTQTKINSKHFVTQRNLETLMKLAIGDQDTWDRDGMQYCETWYEYLVTRLLYSEPGLKCADLGTHAKRCVDSWTKPMTHLDNTILAVMEQDIHQVIHEIQQMSENGWFVTHLTDLLYHRGVLGDLDMNKKIVSKILRESLLLDYGSLLMSHHSLWQVGASYLSNCTKYGKQALTLLLSHLPLGSETRTMRIINVAKLHGLDDLIVSICKQKAMMCIKRKRLGHALSWALRSHDANLSSHLADSLLKSYCKQGTLHCTDVLNTLGSAMLLSDRLVFLGKYCEFHKVYKSGNFKEAAVLLISLLVSKLTPKYFWSTLLMDALPLLEYNEIVFSSNDTYELLNCIEENESEVDLIDKIKLLRLAAARNLARSSVYEVQSMRV